MKVIAEFFKRGVISNGVNAIFIVLIPKEDVRDFSDFWLISLVYNLYKIIAKVLSLRLRGVMGRVMSNTQGAFVKGKQIMVGIFITNECVVWKRKAKNLGLVYKIDLEKAYDRVD